MRRANTLERWHGEKGERREREREKAHEEAASFSSLLKQMITYTEQFERSAGKERRKCNRHNSDG